ncbi:MAG: ISAs1 family transposase, partial [Rhodoplanes sp.]
KGKIVTGDAIFCQKSIAAKIVERGGDYVFPVKDNQKTLRQDIETAFNEPVFPLCSWNSGVEKAHGRIEWRAIDVLPTEAAGIQGEGPTVRQICRVIRSRQVKKNGEWQKPQHEVVYLVSSLPAAASPQALLGVNRDHWRIEIMHRNKDVILGEDGYTNRCDNAPRNIFSLTGFVLKILKSVAPSPTRAIEHFQDDRNRAIRLFSGFY